MKKLLPLISICFLASCNSGSKEPNKSEQMQKSYDSIKVETISFNEMSESEMKYLQKNLTPDQIKTHLIELYGQEKYDKYIKKKADLAK